MFSTALPVETLLLSSAKAHEGTRHRAFIENVEVANCYLRPEHNLTFYSRPKGSFFFDLKQQLYRNAPTQRQFWSAGLGGHVKKKQRRSPKNLLTWWNIIFGTHLLNSLHKAEPYSPQFLYLTFKGLNNTTLRYLFMINLFLTVPDHTYTLYILKYDFFIRFQRGKKRRCIKKFKSKSLVHVDRFTRREFWLGL